MLTSSTLRAFGLVGRAVAAGGLLPPEQGHGILGAQL